MTGRAPAPSGARRRRRRRSAGPIAVQVLFCGSTDRGDDGAPIFAAAMLAARLPPDVGMRIVGQLDIDDLLAVPNGAAMVIVDTAVGVPCGQTVELPIDGLIGRAHAVGPRSSHALTIPEVVGLAGVIRGRPLPGRIVAIGGSAFGLGRPLSGPVSASLPRFAEAVLEAVASCRDERDGI